MSDAIEKTKYGRRGRMGTGPWLGAVLLALAGGAAGLAGSTPAPVPPPELAGLYRPVPRPFRPVLRREGDSLRLFVNYAVPAAGSAPAAGGKPASVRWPTLALTAWADYAAAQPQWQQTYALHPYPGSDPAAPVQVLTLALPAGAFSAGQVLEATLNPPATATTAAASPAEARQDPARTAWLPLTAERLARPFVVLDSLGLVLDRPYVPAGADVAVAFAGANQPVRWRRYQPGGAALPPFTDPRTQPAPARTLGLLDSSAAATETGQLLRLRQPGLYALRVGGRAGQPVRTVPLLVTRPDFPGQTRAAELIESLRYLTAAAERQELGQAPDPKRAVDRFWLAAAGNDQGQARELIRRYYGRVTAANELFTGHKAGWLTDRGLLYVVLGPPQSVTRLPGEERWRYDQAGRAGEAVTFSFRPHPTTLAPDNYELTRRSEYQQLWYGAVEQWRRPQTIR